MVVIFSPLQKSLQFVRMQMIESMDTYIKSPPKTALITKISNPHRVWKVYANLIYKERPMQMAPDTPDPEGFKTLTVLVFSVKSL